MLNLPQAPLKGVDYYEISRLVDETEKLYYGVNTHWVGFTNDNPKREIREASLIIPEPTLKLYRSISKPQDEILLFLFGIGGYAIVEASLARKYLNYLLQPSTSVRTYDKGFLSLMIIPKEKFTRAPNPKLRMKIFDRDNRRCKICGSSPTNNEHVELHIHHILPYSKGGLTEEENLITLCHTCHNGLGTREDYSLYDYIGVKLLSASGFISESYTLQLSRNIIALEKYRKSWFRKKK